jgi:anti-sigma B factor antagonist
MTCAIRAIGDVRILDAEGRLTMETSSERVLVNTVRRLLAEGERKLLLNLERVHQVDSSGLSEMVEAYATTVRQGGQLKVEHIPRYVYGRLQVTHLLLVFETFDVESEAVASFKAH